MKTGNGYIESLERLTQLLDKGAIDKKEFALAKKKLLSEKTSSNKTIGIVVIVIIIFFLLFACGNSVSSFLRNILTTNSITEDLNDSVTEDPNSTKQILDLQKTQCSESQNTTFTQLLEDATNEKDGASSDVLNWLQLNDKCAIEKYGESAYTQLLIDVCQNVAWENYRKSWLSYCRINHERVYDDDSGYKTCDIPIDDANAYESQLQEAKNACIQRYK